jgi:hypothetical protein
MKIWVYDPHSGGAKIPKEMYDKIYKEVESFEQTHPWYPRIQLKPRFKSQFCYIDTVEEGDGRLFPLCRLRHLNRGWSIGLFTYSNDRYEPCVFPNGKWEGTIKEALTVCESFIF